MKNFAGIDLLPLHTAVPAWQGRATMEQMRSACMHAQIHGGRLATLWAADDSENGPQLWVALIVEEGLMWLEVSLAPAQQVPDFSSLFPYATRMQRALDDLFGIAHAGADRRPWLDHGCWPQPEGAAQRAPYAFAPLAGEGVHEIPVGPVHAGIIEPGHFRFSVIGEQVLKLEARLGYTHKGIHRRFAGMDALAGARLAGRVSGDSTVAYAWAYAMALEGIAVVTPTARALCLRALLLERERIANHLGDLGALGNDGGLAFGFAQFMRLKENVLRLNADLFGHRYAMDVIVPGGVTRTFGRHGAEGLLHQCDTLEKEVATLRRIYEDHAGLQDRFMRCGVLTPEAATRLGIIGLAGRASAQRWDVRVEPGHAPYDQLDVRMQTARAGDVAARVGVRFAELDESLRLIRLIVEQLPLGELSVPCALPSGRHRGIGRVEGWRGESLVLLETDGDRLLRCHAHDPSWQNWLGLEQAVPGNIVPDFPLINKSFNLSYSGVDL